MLKRHVSAARRVRRPSEVTWMPAVSLRPRCRIRSWDPLLGVPYFLRAYRDRKCTHTHSIGPVHNIMAGREVAGPDLLQWR